MLHEDRIKQRLNECAVPTEFIETIKRWQSTIQVNPVLVNFAIERLITMSESNPRFSMFYERIIEELEEIQLIETPLNKKDKQLQAKEIKNQILSSILNALPKEINQRPENLYLTEKYHILSTLKYYDFNRVQAAKVLGISPRGLRFKMTAWIRKYHREQKALVKAS